MERTVSTACVVNGWVGAGSKIVPTPKRRGALADLARVVEREERTAAIQEPAHTDAVDGARFAVTLHHRQRQIRDMAERGVMGVAELERLERRRELPCGPDDEAAVGADADVRAWLEHDGVPDPVGVGQRLADRGGSRRGGRGEPDGSQRLEESPLEQARAERIRGRMSDVRPVGPELLQGLRHAKRHEVRRRCNEIDAAGADLVDEPGDEAVGLVHRWTPAALGGIA